VDRRDRGLILRHYPSICLGGLRKNHKNISHDNHSPGLLMRPGPPEYKAEVLTTRPRRSMCVIRRSKIAHLKVQCGRPMLKKGAVE
jgi:hypothetical protein